MKDKIRSYSVAFADLCNSSDESDVKSSQHFATSISNSWRKRPCKIKSKRKKGKKEKKTEIAKIAKVDTMNRPAKMHKVDKVDNDAEESCMIKLMTSLKHLEKMKTDVWVDALSNGERWAVLSLAEDWVRQFILSMLVGNKNSNCSYHCPRNVFGRARWPTANLNLDAIADIVSKAQTIREASRFVLTLPEHTDACKRIIGTKSERCVFWAFVVRFICVLTRFTVKKDSFNVTWDETRQFGLATNTALAAKETLPNLWGERVTLTSMQVFYLRMLGLSGDASIVASPNGETLYLVLGPIAFINATCEKHANILPDSSPTSTYFSPSAKTEMVQDKNMLSCLLQSEWKSARVGSVSIPENSELWFNYGVTFRIVCAVCK